MLESSDVVILDRFVESNIAHQAVMLRSEVEVSPFVDWVYGLEYDVFGMPVLSITVLIDMPVEFSAERVQQKPTRPSTGSSAYLHKADSLYMSKVRDMYRRQAVEHDRTIVNELHPDKFAKSMDQIGEEILRAGLTNMGQLWRLNSGWDLDREALRAIAVLGRG